MWFNRMPNKSDFKSFDVNELACKCNQVIGRPLDVPTNKLSLYYYYHFHHTNVQLTVSIRWTKRMQKFMLIDEVINYLRTVRIHWSIDSQRAVKFEKDYIQFRNCALASFSFIIMYMKSNHTFQHLPVPRNILTSAGDAKSGNYLSFEVAQCSHRWGVGWLNKTHTNIHCVCTVCLQIVCLRFNGLKAFSFYWPTFIRAHCECIFASKMGFLCLASRRGRRRRRVGEDETELLRCQQ